MPETEIQKKLNWGILATGNIARTFARGVRESQTGKLVAVGSRTLESANKFADEFEIPHRHGTYQDLLDNPEIDAVYISTPHPQHAQWAMQAARAGKHILCEKPLTLNHPDAMRVAQSAARNGVLLIEAFMYRCHPQTAKIVELIQSRALGEVRQIEASFAFQSKGGEESRLHNLELGGGGILDVGCYAVSLCRLVAGAATGKEFAEPTELKALGVLDAQLGSDNYAAAILKFPGDILAICSAGVRINAGGFARVLGSEGVLRIPSPWFCGAMPNLILEKGGKEEEITVETDRSLYAYEADLFAASVVAKKPVAPIQSADDAVGNMRVLDWWRKEIGLIYPQEKPERLSTPVGGALRVQSNKMRYGQMSGVVNSQGNAKQISNLVLGTMLEGGINSFTHGLAMFDEFYECGGTCFDTAYVYGGGAGERILGHWMQTRGVRDNVVVIGKGAHPPHCTPEGASAQLLESLERLSTPFVDIYMMHRDNLDVPVSDWVEMLNEHVHAGRIKTFGGSNWSLRRVEEANAYAKAKGLQGFQSVSNNFSLARLVNPVWNGCIASSDALSRAWHEENQMALFSWSSQARGFFARADKNFTDDAELVRCWYSDDNFQRLERAQQLAKERGVSSVVIAAAYVLAQPFPIYALIGPRSLDEIHDSMRAFEIELSSDEVKWLNLED
jgi:predicted dehydrogenase/aryl-alcohol dehydrogenase-like predicted oxidoreductase